MTSEFRFCVVGREYSPHYKFPTVGAVFFHLLVSTKLNKQNLNKFSLLRSGGGGLDIFWVRGCASGKYIDFHDFGIRNGIKFCNFGIRNGMHFRKSGFRSGIYF